MRVSKGPSRAGAFVALAAVAGVGLGACGEEPAYYGNVRIYNDSDASVLILSGSESDTIDDLIIKLGTNPGSIPVGGSEGFNFVHRGDITGELPGKNEEWCSPGIYLIVESISGRTYSRSSGVEDPPLEASDLRVLEQIGPDYCFDGKDSEYHYDG